MFHLCHVVHHWAGETCDHQQVATFPRTAEEETSINRIRTHSVRTGERLLLYSALSD